MAPHWTDPDASRPHLPLGALVEAVHTGCQRALGGHQPGCFPPEILEQRKGGALGDMSPGKWVAWAGLTLMPWQVAPEDPGPRVLGSKPSNLPVSI